MLINKMQKHGVNFKYCSTDTLPPSFRAYFDLKDYTDYIQYISPDATYTKYASGYHGVTSGGTCVMAYNINNGMIQLNADDIVKELASISQDKDVVLICYEGIKNNDFCHRHLVSQWLRENSYDAPGELILNYYKNNKKILNPVKEIRRIEF